MKKTDFQKHKDFIYDREIEKMMKEKNRIPDDVIRAREEAFHQIRMREKIKDGKNLEKNKKKNFSGWTKRAGVAAALAVVFSGVCITNPVLAGKIPVIGHVFEKIGQDLGFSGNFTDYAKPLQDTDIEVLTESGEEISKQEDAYTKTQDGVTISLSEIYCSEKAMYVSMVISSEEPFPETLLKEETPWISLYNSTMDFSYNEEIIPIDESLDGRMLDDHTYAGVLRIDLNPTLIKYITDDAGEEVVDSDMPVEQLTLPDHFSAKLHIGKVVGLLPDSSLPKMPEDIRQNYEDAMREQGISTAEEDYEALTDEQKETENQLFNEMWQQYYERYPEAQNYPNSYENWWFAGDWNFSLDVAVDHSQTITKIANAEGSCDIGEIQVTKTPFEISLKYDYSKATDYFITVLDANGEPLSVGKFGGATDTLAIADHDVSKITVYVCDYMEYMDELKGYWFSDDYAEKSKEKTYSQLLDERAVYSETVTF